MAVRALCGSLLSALSSPLRAPWKRSTCWPMLEPCWDGLSVCSGNVSGLLGAGGASASVRCLTHKSNRSTGPRQNQPRRHWITPELPRDVDERLSAESRDFLQQMVHETYASPLRVPPPERAEYTRYTRRCGLLCRKIGVMPQWTKAGKKVLTTLLQVVDNHVVSMSPSSQFGTTYRGRKYRASRNRLSSLVVGAESIDPTHLTDEYCQLFEPAGLQPKRKLSKMIVSDNAVIPPGTPLRATHFRVGDYVDVGGRTVDYGFQGVVKRWGFRGGPATHGATKQHRRTGSIGFSRHHGRVMKGKKMPGHMGNAYRVSRGMKILRMNTKYDVLYVRGHGVPGLTNSWCMVWDTQLPLRRPLKNPPPMPTHYPEDEAAPLPEEIVHPDLHTWDEPTIVFQLTEDDLKQKARTGAKTALKTAPKAPAAKGPAPAKPGKK